jgi:hypothetical protein
MKIVLVEWSDTTSGSLWQNRAIEQHIDSIISIGILARENDKEIEVIPNTSDEFKLHQIAIPKNNIKRLRVLRV